MGLKLQYFMHFHQENLHNIALSFFGQDGALYLSLTYTLFWFVFAQMLPCPRKKQL